MEISLDFYFNLCNFAILTGGLIAHITIAILDVGNLFVTGKRFNNVSEILQS